MSAPPADHQRSNIWLARDAQANDLTRALALLSTVPAHGDRRGELAAAMRASALAQDGFAVRLAA